MMVCSQPPLSTAKEQDRRGSVKPAKPMVTGLPNGGAAGADGRRCHCCCSNMRAVEDKPMKTGRKDLLAAIAVGLLLGATAATAQVAAPPPPANAPRPSPVALAERQDKLKAAGVAAAPINIVVRPFEDPMPPEVSDGRLDLVTLMFNYHDLGFLKVDRDAMNKAVFKALKPGGIYVIADHSGRPGTGITESGTLHRVEEGFLRKEVDAAGFKLAADGKFLRNPNDPRDKNTPDPPQPKDELMLKFVKP